MFNERVSFLVGAAQNDLYLLTDGDDDIRRTMSVMRGSGESIVIGRIGVEKFFHDERNPP